jgi:citrate synthase
MSHESTIAFSAGLEGVVAAETRLSDVDGKNGELVIAGFPVEELANRASFEETVYLLWHDVLPNEEQLAAFRDELAAVRPLPSITLELLRAAALQRVSVMDALRMAVGTISLDRTDGGQGEDETHQESLALVARFPTIVATYWRLLNGSEPVKPDPGLGLAANYLYMLSGTVSDVESVRALETYLNTVVDHGMNASTFAARVITSTRSDTVSAVVGGGGDPQKETQRWWAP